MCVGLSGLEPPTSRLSGVRSNRLSYKPICGPLKTLYFKLSLISFFKARSHLLSHIVSNAVPSAAYVLTIVFGMGTGVSHRRITTGEFLVVLFETHPSSSLRSESVYGVRHILRPSFCLICEQARMFQMTSSCISHLTT